MIPPQVFAVARGFSSSDLLLRHTSTTGCGDVVEMSPVMERLALSVLQELKESSEYGGVALKCCSSLGAKVFHRR